MAQHFDAQYRAAAESASRKILGVLPEKLRTEVQGLQENIQFIEAGIQAKTQEQIKLQHLRRAILQCTRVRFRYHRRQGSDDEPAPEERETDPYALIHVGDAWYLTAYCHMRRGIRIFRLDRIDDLVLLATTFTRPADFRAGQRPKELRPIMVRVHFDADVARWVREAPSFFTVSMEDTPDGLLVMLQTRHERDVLQWLLGWGRAVHVLEPASLQRLIAEEARAVWQAHQSPEDS
jgi:predicted DNA-binding transcriptional regulator YafY